MVKRVKRAAKVQAGAAAAPAGPGSVGPAPPVHVRRKVTKKLAFLERVAASRLKATGTKSGSVQKKKKRQPSKALGDMSSLEETLRGAAAALGSKAAAQHQPGTSVGTLRARARITEQESQRLQKVLSHPQYQADPIAAITNHLTATLPPPPEAKRPAPDPKLRKKQKKQRQRQARAAGAMAE